MDPAMRDITKRAKSTAEVHTYGATALNTSVTGSTIRLTDRVYTPGSMEDPMRAPGKTIICMGKEHTLGATAESMKVNTTWTKSMGMASTSGQMDADMRATGRTESSTARENTFCIQVL
jgi:hypothetical protein